MFFYNVLKSFVYFSSFLFNELVSTWCLQSSRTGRNQQHAAGASWGSDAARSQMTIATCFRKFAERSLLSLWSDLCSSPRLKLNNKPIQSQSLLLQSTPVERPLFQDNLAKPVPEMYNQFGFKQGKRRRGFWDAVASAGPYANNLHLTSLQTDNHTNTSSLDFYRPDALHDAQPTARQSTWGKWFNHGDISATMAEKLGVDTNPLPFPFLLHLSPSPTTVTPRFYPLPSLFLFSRSVQCTRLTALCPGLPGWAGTRKVNPTWILLQQETVSGNGIRWAICKSAPRSRQITTPAPHHSVFFTGLPAAQPTASKHWRNYARRETPKNLVEEFGAVDACAPHEVGHTARMEVDVGRDVVHFTYARQQNKQLC